MGERLSTSHIHRLNAVINYLETGRWLKARGFLPVRRYSSRRELHEAIGTLVADDCVLYLEFGVFEGDSIRHWSRLLRNPASELHGFDSFEGLPQDWDARRRKGTFDTKGVVPLIDDPRVHFHRGWFHETLPSFVLPPHEQLVVHLDADLYSSTVFVLQSLRACIAPGTILIFDEFCDRFHELKAFEEYLDCEELRFQALAATSNLEQVVFQRLPGDEKIQS
ncbi:MAG: TylF/MycF/NovP-related O-methyltransferase [Bryobacteraceae bacterium]